MLVDFNATRAAAGMETVVPPESQVVALPLIEQPSELSAPSTRRVNVRVTPEPGAVTMRNVRF